MATERAQKLAKHLNENSLVIAVAESCTGGMITSSITQIPGASRILDRGFVTYSNQSKIEMLGVSPITLERHGAVSANVAMEMAEGALKNSAADIAISITGIAGPDGGSPEKPTGLVHFGWASKKTKTKAYKRFFQGSRLNIQTEATKAAINIALKETGLND